MIKTRVWTIFGGLMLLSGLAHGAEVVPAAASAPVKQCLAQGWQRVTLNIAGLPRELLWQGPVGAWTQGAILVMHGGGGHHHQWCVANARAVEAQVHFTRSALAEGFAVFLLDSSDKVTDNEGRVCGKAWDDEVRNRPNLDLPFIGEVLRSVVPRVRPAGSRKEIFVTGLSSGGYMTVRAATHFDDLVTAFAPVSSGDPYGWHRVCQAGLTQRTHVHGAAYDNETGKQIIEPNACLATGYPNEKPWDSANPARKPTYRVFQHLGDGINDPSCGQKVARQLREHGYPEVAIFQLPARGRRNLVNHLWQDAYNAPLLAFFKSQLRREGER